MNNIKQYRSENKITQSELAEELNVSQNTISQWETDIREPNIRKAIELAEVLNTTVEKLYK